MTTIPATATAAPVAEGISTQGRVGEVARYGVIVLQLVLLFLVFRQFELERSSGFHALAPLIVAGFVIHAALPLAFRAPFFVALSIGAFVVVLGAGGIAVVAAGLVLIAICHLPVRFGFRVTILALIGVMLASAVIWGIPGLDRAIVRRAIPVLASMFMFRIIVYMYDLRNERTGTTPAMRLAYFFLLPNAAFPFFPVVDYAAFKRTYYDRPALETYQRGVRLILRGVIHLLLYRLVYYHFSPPADAVAGVRSVVTYFAAAWLVYLHVSGLFHVIVGILCLFGFNLPETNRLYFLASSPNDLWRRVNVYWKDFMLKIFYLPAYKALQKRRVDMKRSMIAATVVVFIATWLLHSYQWFWLLGKFPLTKVDAVFWGVFGALVITNTVYQLRPRRPAPRAGMLSWSVAAAAIHVLKVMGMFMLMSTMFSWWSTRDPVTWIYLLGTMQESEPRSFFLLAAGVVVVFAMGIAVHYAAFRGWTAGFGESVLPFGRSAAVTVAVAIVLLALSTLKVQEALGPRGMIFLSLQRERLNSRDAAIEDRAYYEALITNDQPTRTLFNARNQAEADRVPIRNSKAVRFTNDQLIYELIPSRKTPNKGTTLAANSFGFRDQEYSLIKPPGTYRIAMLGASVIMASGVEQPDSFEALAEERMNREPPSTAFTSYEILNFGLAGYGFNQMLETAERKALRFKPDVLLIGALAGDNAISVNAVADLVTARVPLHPGLDSIVRRTGITKKSGGVEVRRRLRSGNALDEIRAWAYRRIADGARASGAIPVFMYLPRLESDEYPPGFEEMSRDARAAGMPVLDLRGVYTLPREQLMFHRRDVHPNVIGHRMIADRLYAEILAHRSELGLGDTASIRP